MKNKIRIIGALCIVALWASLFICAITMPPKEISNSERRPLDQFPELSIETILNTQFMEKFENYTLDQFPGRDVFRTVKSLANNILFLKKDNNDIYIYNGYAAKMEYPLNEASLKNAIKHFNSIYNTYLKETNSNIYTVVIPDKNYYMGAQSHHLTMDYEEVFQTIKDIEWATNINIVDQLDYGSYYKTDTHWRQEYIMPVAEKICEAMGSSFYGVDDMSAKIIAAPFYGVYYGQAALPLNPEEIVYIETEQSKAATVYDYETSKETTVYDYDAVNDRDMYDTFLHGAKSLLRIDNPLATSDKKLIIFRDSFGSSIAPLLMKEYKTIYLIDTRYIASKALSQFVNFNDADVLFMYSALVLNNSYTFK